MNKNLTITKIVLGATVTILAISPALAVRKKSNSLHKRPMMYYRAAPAQSFYRTPSGYSISQGGPYHNDVLPNGTITGPIAPEANGG